MNSLDERNERQLANQLGRLIGLYRHGINVIENCQSLDSLNNCGKQLRPVMNLIQEAEPALKEEIEKLPKASLQKNPRLRVLFNEQESVLKQFIDSLGSVQDALTMEKQKLTDKVDVASKFRNVSTAYQSQSNRDS